MEKIDEDTYYLSELDQRLLGVNGSYMETGELKDIDVMELFQDFFTRMRKSDDIVADSENSSSDVARSILNRERTTILSMELVALQGILHKITDTAEVSDFSS